MKLLSRKRVADRYDVHPNSVPRLVKQGRLPKPIYPFSGNNRDGRWIESELDEHDATRIAARDAGAAKDAHEGDGVDEEDEEDEAAEAGEPP